MDSKVLLAIYSYETFLSTKKHYQNSCENNVKQIIVTIRVMSPLWAAVGEKASRRRQNLSEELGDGQRRVRWNITKSYVKNDIFLQLEETFS